MKQTIKKVLSLIIAVITMLSATTVLGAEGSSAQIKEGDNIYFGHYPQTADGNDETPIEWIVLEVTDEKALLVSKYGLDAKPYNAERVDTNWEECTLRQWLNNDFMNKAFTVEEQGSVLTTNVDNGESQCIKNWKTSGGNNTQDKIFLLSCTEAKKYFGAETNGVDGARDNLKSRVVPTEYAVSNGAYRKYKDITAEGYIASQWWLRSPGTSQDLAACVRTDGSLRNNGVAYGDAVVRPALYLNLKSANIITPTPIPVSTPKPEVGPLGKHTKKGDHVTFGHYPQTADGTDYTPIEWLVLDVDDGKALLLSKYGLDEGQYNEKMEAVTWENCTLRQWLNNDFINKAFTAEEQCRIPTTEINNNQSYVEWNVIEGNNTQDKAFLLSYAEANKYLGLELYTMGAKDNEKAKVAPTEYAISKGAKAVDGYVTEEGLAAGRWLLRSLGPGRYYNSYVDVFGFLQSFEIKQGSFAIRPAIWVYLEECDNANVENTELPEVDVIAGDIVTLGHYPQTAEGTDNSPIEWIVLDVQNGNVLLLSKYGLDAKPYNQDEADITWETCTLRQWLNDDFMSKAFSAEEQSSILTTNVDNSQSQNYSEWNTQGSNNTQDKIFLLSFQEAYNYLKTKQKAQVAPTSYAIKNGAGTSQKYKTAEENATGWWWLRSPGKNQNDRPEVAFILSSGLLDSSRIYYTDVAVRPALWVNWRAVEQIKQKESEKDGLMVGDTFSFGHYPQTAEGNDTTPIDWIVLEVADGKALLLSKYGLDAKPYNEEYMDITWENCTLRAWLNNDFFNMAFTNEEQSRILMTEVENGRSQCYDDWKTKKGSNNTNDKIFLLSYTESFKYLGVTYGDDRNVRSRVAPTAYALTKGSWVYEPNKTREGDSSGCWWLRSPGRYQTNAAFVATGGNLDADRVDMLSRVVRPALWVSIEK